MSTRAYIGIQNKSGKSIKYIYAHNDNYPEGVGKTLLDHYKTRQKTFKLIALGDASWVGPRINPRVNRKHSFDKPQRDVCVFYTRDRGDDFSDGYKAMSPESFRKHVTDEIKPYGYYMDNEGVWWVTEGGNPFIRLDSLFESTKGVANKMYFEFRLPDNEISRKISEMVFRHSGDFKLKLSDEFDFDFTISDKKIYQEILDILNKNNIVYNAKAI